MEGVGPHVETTAENELDANAPPPAEGSRTLAPWWHTAIVLAQLLALD